MSLGKATFQEIIEFSNELKKNYAGNLIGNYYNQYDVKTSIVFDFYKDDKTLCFGAEDNEVYRLYFLSVDIGSLNEAIKSFPKNSIIEYIYTGDRCPLDFSKMTNMSQIDSFKRYHVILTNDSFSQKLDNRFFDMYIPNCTQFAELKDIGELQFLLKKVFDKRVSHLPTDAELRELIRENNIILCKQNNEIKTFWLLKKEGKRIYSYEAYNSIQGIYMQSLWYKYFTEFKNKNFREVYAWVSDSNFFSLNLHYKFNFTFDRMNLLIFETKFYTGGGTKV